MFGSTQAGKVLLLLPPPLSGSMAPYVWKATSLKRTASPILREDVRILIFQYLIHMEYTYEYKSAKRMMEMMMEWSEEGLELSSFSWLCLENAWTEY